MFRCLYIQKTSNLHISLVNPCITRCQTNGTPRRIAARTNFFRAPRRRTHIRSYLAAPTQRNLITVEYVRRKGRPTGRVPLAIKTTLDPSQAALRLGVYIHTQRTGRRRKHAEPKKKRLNHNHLHTAWTVELTKGSRKLALGKPRLRFRPRDQAAPKEAERKHTSPSSARNRK